MAKLKTPGVYIEEISAFPNSIAQVETAIPAFIGFTEKTLDGNKSLLNTPVRISSMTQFAQVYGGAPNYQFQLQEGLVTSTISNKFENFNLSVQGKDYTLQRIGNRYRLFDAIRFFYHNGGGDCYIVSVGDYNTDISKGRFDGTDAANPGFGLPALENETEPTMIVIPEAVSLSAEDCYLVYREVLLHCEKMANRIGIFDVHNGFKDCQDPTEPTDVIDKFRNEIGNVALKYGAAYYPWLQTSVIQESELSFQNLSDESLGPLQELIQSELNSSGARLRRSFVKDQMDFYSVIHQYTKDYVAQKTVNPDLDENPMSEFLHQALFRMSPAYKQIIKFMKESLSLIPPASGMAGIYTMVDNSRGVWKAPANVSMNSVIKPAVEITQAEQEDLNITSSGKSINAIRSFIGEGVLVWGARTLDGNSNEWRYINVVRTMIMLEQSIKAGINAFVFEPNDANTWAKIKNMTENFLIQQWKMGALAGAKPDEAFAVKVGLGQTMTANDILNGLLKVNIMVAVLRPAEFLVMKIEEKMLNS
ncbi:MAG TPA: phage tail sheath C-terminal domain-containing protein [Bacteroidales bacterium]|nr:phage tail sheath C-terminal domain-containing protein [Bacteroidales bacterium]